MAHSAVALCALATKNCRPVLATFGDERWDFDGSYVATHLISSSDGDRLEFLVKLVVKLACGDVDEDIVNHNPCVLLLNNVASRTTRIEEWVAETHMRSVANQVPVDHLGPVTRS
jgi:hypothetical protein